MPPGSESETISMFCRTCSSRFIPDRTNVTSGRSRTQRNAQSTGCPLDLCRVVDLLDLGRDLAHERAAPQGFHHDDPHPFSVDVADALDPRLEAARPPC